MYRVIKKQSLSIFKIIFILLVRVSNARLTTVHILAAITLLRRELSAIVSHICVALVIRALVVVAIRIRRLRVLVTPVCIIEPIRHTSDKDSYFLFLNY